MGSSKGIVSDAFGLQCVLSVKPEAQVQISIEVPLCLGQSPQTPCKSHTKNMAPSSLQHRRTHNLLLISKLLNQRDGSSPFTLVLDSLEQSGKPLLAEFVKRAHVWEIIFVSILVQADYPQQTSNTQVIFVSFETLRKPSNAAIFVEAWKQSLPAWQKEVVVHLKTEPTQSK